MPLTADRVDTAHDLGVREIFGRPEGHVFEEVCEARLARDLIPCADAVEHLYAGHREIAIDEQQDGQAVIEPVTFAVGEFQCGL